MGPGIPEVWLADVRVPPQLIPNFLFDKEFRPVASFMKYSPNKRPFERELFDHFRLVFERVA